jgi:hypothetical protein
MKIFGIGLTRSGTTSLHAALVVLGYSSIHYPIKPALRWLNGDYSSETTRGWTAITDLPTSVFFRELDRSHEDVRFIVTTREKNAWLESNERYFNRTPASNSRTIFRDMMRIALYGTAQFNSARFSWVHDDHMQKVQEYFGTDNPRVLFMDVTQGNPWTQLCNFLGEDVPDMKFPRIANPGMGELLSVRDGEVSVKRDKLLRTLSKQ